MLHGCLKHLPIPNLCPKKLFKFTSINSLNSFHTHNEILYFFDRSLQQCSTINQIKQIHSQIITTGNFRSGFLSARLVPMYNNFGYLSDAQKVFKSVPIECNSNLLLWNSILRANISNGYYSETVKIFLKMRNLGIGADGFTFPLVIRAFALIGDVKLCRKVHCLVVLRGFEYQLHVANELMGMYGKIGKMDDACRVFDRMPVRSIISWNKMISGFSNNYDCDSAVDIFRRMDSEGFEPNSVTWTSLISSHARCGHWEEAFHLFDAMRAKGIGITAEILSVVLSVCADSVAFEKGQMIHGCVLKGGFEDYVIVTNSLIRIYGKQGDLEGAKILFLETKDKSLVSWNALIASYAESGLCDEAFEIFSQLKNSGGSLMLQPDVISWSAVICAYSSEGRLEESLDFFRAMQYAGVKSNSVTISSMLAVCAELAALNLGREIHAHVVRALMDCNILVGNGLINMYTKCGSLKEGSMVFENIDSRDLISWNSMISGYGMHGFALYVIAIFYKMIGAGWKPDGVTFVAVLSACSHAGLVAEGRKLFDQMTEVFGIERQMEHYACMVDLLGRAGLLKEASDIVKSMPMEPNACVWGALLNSCRMHKNTEVAEETATQLFNFKNEHSGSYMLLSEIYAASGRWDDSAKIRFSAKTRGLKKVAGQSWIEVNKKVYMFSSGSTCHMNLAEISEILEILGHQIEVEGQSLNTVMLQDEQAEERKIDHVLI